MNTYDAVILLSFGGPEKMEDVMPFLEIVTRGRNIPRARLEEVAHHYERFNGRSPINEITRQQAECLRVALTKTDTPWPVYIGQRNWHPFIEDTLRKMIADGVKRAVGFSTAAHRSAASLEAYVTAVETARQKIGPKAPVIDYVGPWFDHPLFIEAICERITDVIPAMCKPGSIKHGFVDPPLTTAGDDNHLKGAEWVFTAHSIPCGLAKESTYVEELRTTASLVAQKFGKKDWTLAFTSRSGNPADAWLEPDVCGWIREKAKQGTKEILAIPIGFVADHVEVLFDLDVEAKEAADEAGVRFFRAKTVGNHPLFCQMIANVVRARAQAVPIPEQTISATTVLQDGSRQSKVGRASKTCFCFPDSAEPPCSKIPASSGRPR